MRSMREGRGGVSPQPSRTPHPSRTRTPRAPAAARRTRATAARRPSRPDDLEEPDDSPTAGRTPKITRKVAEDSLREYQEIQAACIEGYKRMDELLPLIINHFGIGRTVQVGDMPAVAIVDQFADKDFAYKTSRFNRYILKTLKGR